MKIIVDSLGSDKGCLEILKASRMAADEFGYNIILIGNESELKDLSEKNNISLQNINIVNCTEEIKMTDEPTDIMKSKSECSMAEGLRMLSNNEGDAFVSAGNSGALAVGATLIVKRLKGIKRCAFAPVIPKENGFFMLIDSGANIECKPEVLYQFGIMGSVYMKNVMVVEDPKVGLVNIGKEDCKGGIIRCEAYNLLKNSDINFVGNIEAREIPSGDIDVVVCDGFTGNVILKLYEGMSKELLKKFKNLLNKNTKTRIAGVLINQDLIELKKSMDYHEFGGAPLMGISKPVFKAHGNSDARTFKSAIRLAGEYAKRNVSKIISDNIILNNNNLENLDPEEE